jgi:two-component system, chemotaxis family, protein-glutamate methylesterase/glutaminase
VKYRGGITVVQDPRALTQLERLGELTSLTGPDSHGSLWKLTEDKSIRFRCGTGHAYTVETLRTEQNEAMENILRNALRAAAENSTVTRYQTEHAHKTEIKETIDHAEAELRRAEQRVHLIQQVLNHEA